jgi:chromosome segregation ATPase
MEQFADIITTSLQLLIGGLIAWFLRGKKDKIEVAQMEITLYREMVDDLSTRLKEAINSIHELEEKVEALTNELSKYKQLNGKSIT